ncbi:unnamed protein product [Ambrosiozyma monospora]|uniref:Unnamed protein product n=1 Tax=Ambrosiozyma monospora TaxID=43982 RepID=A0A9W6Z455_AMBMO|nr:unnamed protein product [Ambrosiozyma monospora]
MLLFSLKLVNGPTLPATPAPFAAVLLGLLTEVALDPLPLSEDPAALLLTCPETEDGSKPNIVTKAIESLKICMMKDSMMETI